MALIKYEKIAGASRERTSPPTTLRTVEENSASGEVAALYEHFRSHFGRPDVPGILKCFATHPPLLRHMMQLSESLIFADGALSRRQKEMIATLISVENNCAYCADSHAYFLRVHGGSSEAMRAIEKSDLQSPALAIAEQALLSFAQKVNRASHEIDTSDVLAVSEAGWSELQIAEAIHVAPLFAAFNRVANAFGLQSQGLLALYANDPALPPAQPSLSASTPDDTSEKVTTL